MQKSQNFCQNIKADRKLTLAVFLISISILNVFIRASWGFYATTAETSRTDFEIKESVGNETVSRQSVDSSFENHMQKLHFTTVQPTKTQSK